MRRQFVLAALLGLAILTVGTSATLAARGSGNVLYVFNGRMMADAGSNPTIAVDVNGGNKPALRKLVGQSDNANFAVDAHTQYIRWTHGVPTVVPESNLLAGDRVSVRILAERRASLAQIEGTPARRVADSGPSGRFPRQSLWLFQGALDRPVGGGHLTLHISDGNKDYAVAIHRVGFEGRPRFRDSGPFTEVGWAPRGDLMDATAYPALAELAGYLTGTI